MTETAPTLTQMTDQELAELFARELLGMPLKASERLEYAERLRNMVLTRMLNQIADGCTQNLLAQIEAADLARAEPAPEASDAS